MSAGALRRHSLLRYLVDFSHLGQSKTLSARQEGSRTATAIAGNRTNRVLLWFASHTLAPAAFFPASNGGKVRRVMVACQAGARLVTPDTVLPALRLLTVAPQLETDPTRSLGSVSALAPDLA